MHFSFLIVRIHVLSIDIQFFLHFQRQTGMNGRSGAILRVSVVDRESTSDGGGRVRMYRTHYRHAAQTTPTSGAQRASHRLTR